MSPWDESTYFDFIQETLIGAGPFTIPADPMRIYLRVGPRNNADVLNISPVQAIGASGGIAIDISSPFILDARNNPGQVQQAWQVFVPPLKTATVWTQTMREWPQPLKLYAPPPESATELP